MADSQPRSKRTQLIRTLLVFFFIYGGVSYSLSLFEYTYFNLTGQALFGVSKTIDSISKEELINEFHRCGGPLFGANSVETEQLNDPIVVRCGRFWPFYRYSMIVPANGYIPGALIKYPDQPAEVTQAKEDFIQNTTVINGGYMLLSLIVFSLTLLAVFHFFVKKDEEKGYKWAFQAFASSLLMAITYVGVMFFVDPVFSLGW
ncbi:hypothetical protein [Alkalimarinus sediminis]|uniref:Uncharacterized protein n=1 Tax=Alkalimarinus sediminis TaxID=1632866 RepID=A0A9E8HI00_9ALTE|nr:hypothetical protein [Alkalimarinus sediminis]UZW74769.1 hypothetical protein NNL22_17380 [Alkalimarinus sediminis]